MAQTTIIKELEALEKEIKGLPDSHDDIDLATHKRSAVAQIGLLSTTVKTLRKLAV